MKKLINYNRAVFITGTWFTKFWMISFPIFILFLIFGNVSTNHLLEPSTLWEQRIYSWPLLVFYISLLIVYPFRNLYLISRLINKYNSGNIPIRKMTESDNIITKVNELME